MMDESKYTMEFGSDVSEIERVRLMTIEEEELLAERKRYLANIDNHIKVVRKQKHDAIVNSNQPYLPFGDGDTAEIGL